MGFQIILIKTIVYGNCRALWKVAVTYWYDWITYSTEPVSCRQLWYPLISTHCCFGLRFLCRNHPTALSH